MEKPLAIQGIDDILRFHLYGHEHFGYNFPKTLKKINNMSYSSYSGLKRVDKLATDVVLTLEIHYCS